jgi:hypothetical protein
VHRVSPRCIADVGRELLAFFDGDANRWTQGSTAKDDLGEPIGSHSKHAVCWCLEGAVIRCGIGDGAFALFQVLGMPVTTWNDAPDRSFRDVNALLKRMAEGDCA